MKKYQKVLISVLLLAIIVAIAGINLTRNKTAAGLPVQTGKAKVIKLQSSVFASGKVKTVNQMDIYSLVSGEIQLANLKIGQRVKKGEVLALIDAGELLSRAREAEATLATGQANLKKARAGARPQELAQEKARLSQAEANLTDTKRKLARVEQLYQDGAVAREEWDNAKLTLTLHQADYQSALQRFDLVSAGESPETLEYYAAQVRQAEITLAAARAKLKDTTVKAPLSGVVVSKNVSTGQFINAGTQLGTVANLNDLVIKADIGEVDAASLRVGQPVKITGAALGGRSYRGSINSIAPVAVSKIQGQGEQTTVEVEIKVLKADPNLRPGYTVDLNITTATHPQAVVIPYEGLMERAGKKFIFVAEQEIARRRQVQTGIGNELNIEIIKGIKPGELVILNPPEKLKDQDKVKVELPGNKAAAGAR